MEDKKLVITFADEAFNRHNERVNLDRAQHFTRRVAEMNRAAQILDRHDEFDKLSLHPADYAQHGEYGIPKMRQHIGEERLLPNQVAATQRFLRELRGFGLLADVVGSGKTYEACSVLSELAEKGKISSLLLIVPSQVYNTWIEVLERRFGLGIGVLKTIGDTFERGELCTREKSGLYIPNVPYIVKSEDFVSWTDASVADVLFDAVVVDEAHNLCAEEGKNAHALKLLSYLMQTKKRAEKTYCVLLSATPHSGNLEHMFRLWYFVRCKGGDPKDFDEKDDRDRTAEYRKEQAHYRDVVCHGATTVMEFIENVRYAEVTGKHGAAFRTFLAKNDVPSLEAFHGLLKGAKKKLITSFLEQKPKIDVEVNDAIAAAYHVVLRSIMIRQPSGGHGLAKGKRIENIFFFPSHIKKTGKVTANGLDGKPITVDVALLASGKAITDKDGEQYTVEEYISEKKGNAEYRHAYSELFFNKGILSALGMDEKDFDKQGAVSFYWEAMEKCLTTESENATGVGIRFAPLFDGSLFDAKLAELKSILRKYKEERVLVFFDYDIPRTERCFEQVLESLQNDKEFSSRIIVGDASTRKDKIEAKFNEKSDSVLVVTDNAFTEGANLQKSHVIINFQVTPNPLSMEQRIGRIFRLGQDNNVVIYSLADMRALEGYVLMYFTAIGLMTSNNGDAAIIAGSNNDNMITLRCRACDRVRLMSRDEYEEIKQNDPDDLYCNARKGLCDQTDKKGTIMEVINSNELKCTSCGSVIRRESDNRYHCFTHNNLGRGVLCNNGEKGDRQLYCNKICVISNCRRFNSGELAGKCPALKRYREKPYVSPNELEAICNDCPHTSICPSQCRLTYSQGPDAILKCMKCGQSECHRPGPHVINFDDNWTAECPACGKSGRLMPVVARTFETYIRSAYDYQQDGGESFCHNLLEETNKVSVIQQILSKDDE